MSTGTPGRVVHLSTVHHTHDNRVFNKEARALAASGVDFHLVITADRDGDDDGIPVVALTKRSSRPQRLIAGQLETWQVLKRLRPDVLQIHDPELIPLACLWGRVHSTRTIYDAHEDLVDQIATKPYLGPVSRPVAKAVAWALVRLADRRMDAIVAATPTVANRFHGTHTVVVRNYPWLSNFTTSPKPVPGRLVYVGDLSQERKLSFMIDVVRRVRDSVPEAHLVLAGRILPGCEDTVARAVAEGFVDHRGLVDPTEVAQIVATGQVGLVMLAPLPNYLRSLPTKLFEYMAAGVPFCASDFPAWRESFGHHHAGVFVNTESLDDTAEVLAQLLADPRRCRQMGEDGRRAVEAGLTFESQAEVLIKRTRLLLDDSLSDTSPCPRRLRGRRRSPGD